MQIWQKGVQGDSASDFTVYVVQVRTMVLSLRLYRACVPLLFDMHVLSHLSVLVPRSTRFGLCSIDLSGQVELELFSHFATGRENLAGVQWHQATSRAECT